MKNERFIADDGAGNALMKEADIEEEAEEVLLGLHFLPVHVHHIAQQLEGVETDADGQGDDQDVLRNTKPVVEVLEEEGQVFKDTQQADVDDTADDQPPFPCRTFPVLAHLERHHPVGEGHPDEQEQIGWACPGVEDQ